MTTDIRDRPLRLAVVGCGDIAVTQHLPAIARSPDVALLGVIERDAVRRAEATTRWDVPAFPTTGAAADAGAECAVVATPPEVTPSLVVEAVGAGLHVLCEKPMATDVAAGERLSAAVHASDRIVQVGFTNRFSPLVQRVAELARTGALGSPLVLTLGAYDERYDPDDGEHLARMTHFLSHGPAFVHEGAHLTDYVALLTGGPPARVMASGACTSRQFPAENFTAAVLEWESGNVARLEVGWLFPAMPRGHFRVLGPGGWAEIDRRAGRLTVDYGNRREELSLDRDWNAVCFDAQLAHFVAAVRGQVAPSPTVDDGLTSLRVAEAVVRSMREHRSIELAAATSEALA